MEMRHVCTGVDRYTQSTRYRHDEQKVQGNRPAHADHSKVSGFDSKCTTRKESKDNFLSHHLL